MVYNNIKEAAKFLLFCACILFFSNNGYAAVDIKNIRHWAAPDHTRIVIDTSEEAQYRVEKDDMLLTIEVTGANYIKTGPRTMVLRKPGIDRIRTSFPSEGSVRIDLHLTEHTEIKVFRVKRIEDKPDRIVIDIILPEVEKKEQEDRERVKEYTKDKIIVIDPGHGGEDPGAVGLRGTQEKRIVLAIGRKVRDKLNAREGYHAFLTREGDYYVSFKKRLKIAREYGADLFISIHADASRSRLAYGTSVYSLSLRGASSEAAKILARNENLADIVGGAVNGDGTKEGSDPIILNMFQTNTMNSAKTFGNLLLKNMAAVNRIKFNSVQEAPFMVLKLPEIPSILVETAYISNPGEEKKLKSRRFQNEIAETIAQTAVEFLSSSPAKTPTVVIAKTDNNEVLPKVEKSTATKERKRDDKKENTVFHMVKRGESVDRIARKYRVSPALILKANDMIPKDPLYANRKIIIPVKSSDTVIAKKIAEERGTKKVKEEVATKTYTVKKGESLDSIAVKQGTNYLVLMRINGMKKADTLYAGKKIKIPAAYGDEPEKAPKSTSKADITENKVALTFLHYKVKRGDTLEKIARSNETTLAELLRLNNMKLSAPLYVGKVIKIREDGSPVESKKAGRKKTEQSSKRQRIYIVKKGDSLDAIARKHKTTVNALRDLNQGKRLSPLYVDQRLKIPVPSRI